MDRFTVKVEQMIAREVRVARGWLIAVAVLTLTQQMVLAFNLPPKLQDKQQFYVMLACSQFAIFLVLWLLARTRPKQSLIVALIVFWVLELGVVLLGPSVEFPGLFSIVLRLAFTLALIGGISAAYRAEELARNQQAPEAAESSDGA